MDQPLIPAALEHLLQFAILLIVVVGFFRQFATQRDIKRLDDRMVKLETGQTELKAGLAAVESRQSAVENRLTNVENRLGDVENRQGALENQFSNLEGAVRENGKKVDASLELHNTVHIDMQVLQASVNRLDSYFETPKLKSS
ncbi:MAG: hypothetical protein OXI77_18685 [Chloroflexota bacterium]|nr:hypothetical protein [Chloroflexota bacterium]MDE2910633.1 hypothetical protein [Chloroflexota bacterium]